MQATEANFDGLVGPTHNYAGLSFGNVASQNNEKSVANPKAAAKQGLRKMKQLADLGFHQGVLPPQERPSMRLLRELGFTGDDATVIARVAKDAPELLAAASSASAMWTANAATVSPSADTHDGRVHFTPANLCSKLHRAIEHESTRRSLRAIFADPKRFAVHEALPGTPALGDEGAANHTRFCAEYGARASNSSSTDAANIVADRSRSAIRRVKRSRQAVRSRSAMGLPKRPPSTRSRIPT
jgi:succinylarginine dihydrolase